MNGLTRTLCAIAAQGQNAPLCGEKGAAPEGTAPLRSFEGWVQEQGLMQLRRHHASSVGAPKRGTFPPPIASAPRSVKFRHIVVEFAFRSTRAQEHTPRLLAT